MSKGNAIYWFFVQFWDIFLEICSFHHMTNESSSYEWAKCSMMNIVNISANISCNLLKNIVVHLVENIFGIYLYLFFSVLMIGFPCFSPTWAGQIASTSNSYIIYIISIFRIPESTAREQLPVSFWCHRQRINNSTPIITLFTKRLLNSIII